MYFYPTASVQHHHGNNDQDTVKIAATTTSNPSPLIEFAPRKQIHELFRLKMCGIAGLLSLNGEVCERNLIAMRDSLVHRGPDDAGIWIDEKRSIGLAHRRLSIIDLSDAGRQPMTNEDGTIVMVFNGEIYDFPLLRSTLNGLGHVFRSTSDSEVIVHAYEEWGYNAFQRLNGMFSIALLDLQRGQLVLARDRFGEKPLFYYNRNGRFAFSSELKALAANPGLDLVVDTDVLNLYLLLGYIPYPQTPFLHTHKVTPGEYLVVDVASHQVDRRKYWTVPEAGVHDVKASGHSEDILRELDTTLNEAVKTRLVADVPVGAFLSGGIDSSLVVSYMAKEQANVKTFTIGFWEKEFDEAPYARAIAEHLGCEHHERYVSPQDVIEVLLKLPAMIDEPFADSSVIPTYMISRFAREHVKVALSGDGGDELFGGYATYGRFAWCRPLIGVPRRWRELAARVLRTMGTGKVRRHAELLEFRETWELFLYLNERTIAKIPDVEDVLLAPGVLSPLPRTIKETFASSNHPGLLQKALLADLQTYLVDDNLTKVDRASMAASLEVRIPFLDVRFAELAIGLSANVKLGRFARQPKRLLHALLSRHVPPELFRRPKRGFTLPISHWFKTELRWLLDDYLNPTRLKREGLFNPVVVSRLVDEHLSGTRDREALLWALIFWEMWHENWPT